MRNFIIIAKTYEQFVRCCNQNRLSVKTTPHITSAVQIARIRGAVEPIFFGDFWNLPGYPEMEIAMRVKGIQVNGQYINQAKAVFYQKQQQRKTKKVLKGS